MGRSVSTPHTAELIAYTEWWTPDPETDELYAQTEPGYDDWDWYVESLTDYARELWPSLTPCDEWLGREDHAILENELAYFGVSEYCGLAAIWAAPKEMHWSDTFDREQFGRAWCRTIAPTFSRYFSTLDRLGGMSDGTSVYLRKDATS